MEIIPRSIRGVRGDAETNHWNTLRWTEITCCVRNDRCLVVISHSQDFLNGVCTHTMHLTPTCKLQNYTGNYGQFSLLLVVVAQSMEAALFSCCCILHLLRVWRCSCSLLLLPFHLFLFCVADMFIKTKAELEVQQMKQYNKEQEDIKHIKAFIASCGTYSNLVRQGTLETNNKQIHKHCFLSPPALLFFLPVVSLSALPSMLNS